MSLESAVKLLSASLTRYSAVLDTLISAIRRRLSYHRSSSLIRLRVCCFLCDVMPHALILQLAAFFATGWGSPAICTATVLTDPRLKPSFAQLSARARSKLLNALNGEVASGGLALLKQTLRLALHVRLVQNKTQCLLSFLSSNELMVLHRSSDTEE